MYAQLFTQSPLLALPLIALALFVAVFLGAVARVFGRGAVAYEPISRLPLEDDAPRNTEVSDV